MQMSSKLISALEKLEFGKTLLTSDLECIRAYLPFCCDDVKTNYVTAPDINESRPAHVLSAMLWDLRVAISRLSSNAIPTTDVAATPEVPFRNLARLARLVASGDDLIRMQSRLSIELATLPSGVIIGTGSSKRAISDWYIQVALWLCGAGAKDFIGEWDNQKYATQDEISGGMWIVLFYVCKFYGMHVASILTLLTSIGSFSKEGGAMRGNMKPLIASDQNTWGSLLTEQENLEAENLFGISTDYLDDPTLRAISVVKVDGLEPLLNTLLSPSQWTWRFGRTVQILPLYFLTCPTGGDDDAAAFDSFVELVMFIDGTNNKWKAFNNALLDVVTSMTNLYFKNGAYGNLKKMFHIVSFGDYYTIPASGNGGLLGFQMAHVEPSIVEPLTDEAMYHKFLLDTENGGHGLLQTRRSFNHDKRTMVIGDIDIDAYRLHMALTTTGVLADGSEVDLSSKMIQMFRPCAFFGFGIGKTEDEPYKIGRAVYDLANADFMDGDNEPIAVSPKTWALYPVASADASCTDSYPVSLQHSKEIFKAGRAADPFKKLNHLMYDINELDVDLVVASIRKLMWPITVGSIKTSFIPVSAIASPIDQPIVSDDVNSKKETSFGPIAVSASVGKIASDIKKAEGEVKDLKKDLQEAKKV